MGRSFAGAFVFGQKVQIDSSTAVDALFNVFNISWQVIHAQSKPRVRIVDIFTEDVKTVTCKFSNCLKRLNSQHEYAMTDSTLLHICYFLVDDFDESVDNLFTDGAPSDEALKQLQIQLTDLILANDPTLVTLAGGSSHKNEL